MRKRVATYTRVSSTTDRQSVDSQTLALKNFCDARGWEIVAEYSDKRSGRTTKRTEFLQMKKDAFNKDFDLVLVFRFDRFARSLKDLILGLEYFKDLGLDFVSVNEQIDTSTAMGKMFFQIAGAFAEFESSVRSETIRAGLDVAKSKGKNLGRPKGKPMKKEDQIVAMLQDGSTHKQIHRELKVSTTHIEKVSKKRKEDLSQMNLIDSLKR